MSKRQRRRKWSADEKRMICAQARLAGISVSQVARRYDVNANLVFNWLKDPRFAASGDEADGARFLPVDVVGPSQVGPQIGLMGVGSDAGADPGEMVVDVAGGHRLRITGRYDPDALAALIRKLTP